MWEYNEMTSSEYLAHHGVKGMRWGVRRERRKEAANARRKAASEEYEGKRKKALANIDSKISKLGKSIPENPFDAAYRKSKSKDDYDNWYDSLSEKKQAALDEQHAAWERKYHKDLNKLNNLHNERATLEGGRKRVKESAQFGGIAGAMLMAPAAGVIAAKATKQMSAGKRALAVEHSGMKKPARRTSGNQRYNNRRY